MKINQNYVKNVIINVSNVHSQVKTVQNVNFIDYYLIVNAKVKWTKIKKQNYVK